METYKLTKFWGASLEGILPFPVSVEINIKRGIPRFQITGLPSPSIKESTDRIRIAIENSGFEYTLQNILVHLAPAGRKKEGTYLDLPIAAGILHLTEQLPPSEKLEQFLFLGELGLDGTVKPLKGILPILSGLENLGFSAAVVPFENRKEASLIGTFPIYTISHLKDLVSLAKGEIKPEPRGSIKIRSEVLAWKSEFHKSQLPAIRAIQIASAGFHHCLLSGPPGAGKTMLAKLAYGFLPKIQEKEGIELLGIRSLQENLSDTEVERPFRTPHHTTSDIALVGGSSSLRMGEVSLAGNGILFLDELSEFNSRNLQALREPMEEGKITISRIKGSITYPASFLFIGATNPCPCGYYQSLIKECNCSVSSIRNYQSPFNGPFLDRIEIFYHLGFAIRTDEKKVSINLKSIRDSIQTASDIQRSRLFRETGKLYNGKLRGEEVERMIPLSKECEVYFWKAVDIHKFSIRKVAHFRKVARTIADLEGSKEVLLRNLEEALVFLNSGWSPENRAVT
ncbi:MULTISPECIES: YifB family Mg chelatase-like AAA ATPase [unclassified Leptospira]|uniref:YifB family Mg chelatase-like AAA ATPase n=1 Tax=unclassified Leptospira TaxID=2633828 RepID=UPI0002BDE874|nr:MULTISPECIES: YifB family Mg chelatase-like AAA ATPase [unclassified Leptospira]EMK01660.1 Mg chelatase-like protein [Leptospira sp. B5-022]MCR1793826.1 YifB family Mg chelatase-like AAA ATPase [Leptospira sp. id769339]